MVVATIFSWCLSLAFRSIWGIGVTAVFLHAHVNYAVSRPALGSWPILIVAVLATRQSESQARTP
jgi:hypothetical protein